MKNKKRIVLFIGLTIFVCLLFVVNSFISVEVSAPERPKNVPESAVWFGGVDGGQFIDVFLDDSNLFFVNIYSDFNGEIWDSGYFEYHGATSSISIDEIKNNLDWYDGSTIKLKDPMGMLTLKTRVQL